MEELLVKRYVGVCYLINLIDFKSCDVRGESRFIFIMCSVHIILIQIFSTRTVMLQETSLFSSSRLTSFFSKFNVIFYGFRQHGGQLQLLVQIIQGVSKKSGLK